MKKLASLTILTAILIPAHLGHAQPPPPDPPTFSYKFFKVDIPVELDVNQIAVFDEAQGSQAEVRRQLEAFGLRVQRMDTLSDGWCLVDLSDGPSGGDPVAVVGLLRTISDDPMSTLYAAPVFGNAIDQEWMLPNRSVNVRFDPSVSRSEALMDLATVGLDVIVEEDWQVRHNLFRVATGLRSGVDMMTAANQLALHDHVIYAHPAWRMFGLGLRPAEPELDPAPLTSSRSPFEVPLPPVNRSTVQPAVTAKTTPLCQTLDNPADPNIPDSWGLDQPSDIDVDAAAGWSQCSGSADTRLVVMGDGVATNHPDLPNVVLGGDTTGDCEPGAPCIGEPQTSCDIHETTVAGIASSVPANGQGSVGVAPNVTIVSIRVATYDTSLGFCRPTIESTWVAAGISRAVDLGGDVTNLSWNWLITRPQADVVDAYRAAYEAGVVHFNSAGNFGEAAVRAPGNIPEVNSVSGINSVGVLFKKGTFESNHGPNVAFTGPGRIIFTTDRIDGEGYVGPGEGSHGDNYVLMNGTSYAAPHLAGIAALILSCRPDLAPRDVEFLFRITAKDLGSPGRDDEFGHGLGRSGAGVAAAPGFIFQSGFEDGGFSGWSSVVAGQ